MASLPPFQNLLDAHGPDVHRFLVAAAGPADADDCYQEACFAALRAYPRLQAATNLRGWLFAIAHRKALDAHRARRRAPVPVAAVPEQAAPAPLPERDEALWERVHALPPKQRGAVLLRFVADLSHAEIGAALGCSDDAARRSLHEGLTRLRTEWADTRTEDER